MLKLCISFPISTQWILRGLVVFVFVSPVNSCRYSSLALGQDAPEAQDLKFSHRVHLLRAKAACEDCHAVARNSTGATDDLLPSEPTCLKCHNGRQAGNHCTVCHNQPDQVRRVRRPARTFRFNHRLHLQLGNLTPVIAAAIDGGSYLSAAKNIREHLDPQNPCSACHRALERVDLAGNSNLPQMADCLVCHAEIDPPFSCEFCHTKNAQIKPLSHTPDYLDLHNSGRLKLEKETCVICHGHHFRCMGCH